MKPKKTFKALAELTADLLSGTETATEKANPPESPALTETPREIVEGHPAQLPTVRGYQNWGINE
jgi:hypothetical protein